MTLSSRFSSRLLWPLLLLVLVPAALAQQFNPNLYAGMRWRLVGPFRAGRAIAVTGIPTQPEVYYFGGVGGGIWKTNDAGRTWKPIFDSEKVSSIGALAIAPSNPRILYAGTGEADMRSDISVGNGMYKSIDGGKTWQFIGLAGTRQIGSILVDPHNPNRVLVAALGHAYGPNPERGVFLTTDGGHSWRKVLYKNPDTGAIDLAADPANPNVIYASLWQTRRPPWSVYPPTDGLGSGLYRSSDGGDTWTHLTGHGLPAGTLGRIGVAVGRHGRTVYAIIDAVHPGQRGLYRSDDSGQTWKRAGTDPRILGRLWYFGHVTVDPENSRIVYLQNVAVYRSSNGGRTFTAVKGAPGGDDYHTLWINPLQPKYRILGTDQGVVVSVNGGETWSSWYNQPTAQFYHVVTDNRFPFWIYGAQQDSGTVAVVSRSDYGEISFRDWHPVGGGESGYIAPDPLDPNIVYAGGTYGELTRYDNRTGQVKDINPVPTFTFGENPAAMKYRFTWTSPLVFSPINQHTLYYGAQVLLKTDDGGHHWQQISPDLTVVAGEKDPDPSAPLSVANARARKHGVIYTVAPSPLRAGEIWVGTDDGLIQLTRNGGKNWSNVTPPGLAAWSKISLIEASHFDPGTAWAAVDRHRLDDIHPYIYRTEDFGKSWQLITQGLPADAYVHVVREDPTRKGLLYAGTEFGVFVSFDNGGHWQPLQLNLPTAPVRDLAIRQGDLVAATHGRAFWVLDDLSPLRQISAQVASAPVYLFRPATAIRIRRTENQDTPLPPETPVGTNPPNGAIFDYVLHSKPAQPVELQILDASGKLIRSFRSNQVAPPLDTKAPFPTYWLTPEEILPAHTGMNRFVWNLRYPTPAAVGFGYGMGGIINGGTDRLPRGPMVLPGRYTVRLIADGHDFTRPFTVKEDPRVHVTEAVLASQLAFEQRIMADMRQSQAALLEAEGAIKSMTAKKAAADSLARVKALAKQLGGLNGSLSMLLTAVDTADSLPTGPQRQALPPIEASLQAALRQWQEMKARDLAGLTIVPAAPGSHMVAIESSY